MERRIVRSWLQLTVAVGLIAFATLTRADAGGTSGAGAGTASARRSPPTFDGMRFAVLEGRWEESGRAFR